MGINGEVLIAHDYFDIRGGGERLALTMARALNAGLLFGFRSAQSYDEAMFPDKVVEFGATKLFRKPGLRTAALAMRFAGHDQRIGDQLSGDG